MGFLTRCKRPFLFAFLLQFCNMLFSFFLKTFLILFEKQHSLSPRVHEILREELGFTGVTVTDDLYMDGIRDFVDVEGAAVQAVLAGNDLLCCTDFEVQIPAVLAAVEQGVVPETRVDEAVRRILTLKQKLGLLG